MWVDILRADFVKSQSRFFHVWPGGLAVLQWCGKSFLSFRNFAVVPPLAASVCLRREQLDELVTEAFGVSGHGLVWGTAVRFIPCLPVRTVRLGAVEGFSQAGPLLGASTLYPTGPQMWSPQPKCPGALVNTGLWAPPELPV